MMIIMQKCGYYNLQNVELLVATISSYRTQVWNVGQHVCQA